MRSGWLLALMLVAVAVALLASACGGEKDKVAREIELDDYYFKPKALSLTAGQPVTLKLENEGKNLHTFTIADLSVDVSLDAGKSQEVTITPGKGGTFRLVCRVHEISNGMTGTVTVAGAASSSSSGSGPAAPPGTPVSSSPYRY